MGAFIGIIIGVIIAAASAANGSEVPGITPADFAQTASPFWAWIAGEGLWPAIVVAVLAFAYKLLRPYIAEYVAQSRMTMLYEAVEAGVIGTYETYTKEIKRANADGKLTAEEAATAKAMAKEYAIAYMKANGVDVIKTYGQQVLDGLIEYFVGSNKAAKAVVAPLPDLEP